MSGRLAMADDGSVVMVGRVSGVTVDGHLHSEEGNAILHWHGGHLRVLVDADDHADDGLPYGRLAHVLARGDRVAFLADHATTDGPQTQVLTHRRRFLLDGGDATPRRVYPPPGEPGDALWRPVDLNAAGALLIEDAGRSLLLDPALFHPIEVADLSRQVFPFAINDAGAVAALRRDALTPGTTTAIVVSGSRSGAGSCPVPPLSTATPLSSTPTPSPTGAPTCIGDCDGDGSVTISELVSIVRCVLGSCLVGSADTACGAGDISGLVVAVNAALNGCHAT